jgi:hypothetical protein
LGVSLSPFWVAFPTRIILDKVLNRSFLGFVSLPIAGTVAVDDVNVTVNIDLPPVVKSFVGEEKVRAIVDENVRAMLAP